jgi:hypothetical protein
MRRNRSRPFSHARIRLLVAASCPHKLRQCGSALRSLPKWDLPCRDTPVCCRTSCAGLPVDHGIQVSLSHSGYCCWLDSLAQCTPTSRIATKVSGNYPPTLLLIRGAVFNFWEPLHFLDQGYGFQTWEVSPAYAIRSWAYVFLHLLPARLASATFRLDKVCGRLVGPVSARNDLS